MTRPMSMSCLRSCSSIQGDMGADIGLHLVRADRPEPTAFHGAYLLRLAAAGHQGLALLALHWWLAYREAAEVIS